MNVRVHRIDIEPWNGEVEDYTIFGSCFRVLVRGNKSSRRSIKKGSMYLGLL